MFSNLIGDRRKFVYFIQPGGDGEPIKIGFSNNLYQRMKQAQRFSPWKVELLAYAPGSLDHEKTVHCKFHHLHMRGEWFWPADELLEFIGRVRKGGLGWMETVDEKYVTNDPYAWQKRSSLDECCGFSSPQEAYRWVGKGVIERRSVAPRLYLYRVAPGESLERFPAFQPEAEQLF